jgi:hypothetical protein
VRTLNDIALLIEEAHHMTMLNDIIQLTIVVTAVAVIFGTMAGLII